MERLIVPAPVVVELDWLMTSRLEPAAFDTFLDSSRVRGADLRYRPASGGGRSQRVGFVDAAVVSIAERYGETKLATLDRRHFGVIRPRHVRSFTLLPAG